MIISKAQLENNVASKDDSRVALKHIVFCKEGAVSTDGKQLLVIPYPDKATDVYTTSADEFFEDEGFPEGEFEILVEATEAKRFASLFPKFKAWMRSSYGKVFKTKRAKLSMKPEDEPGSTILIATEEGTEFSANVVPQKTFSSFPNWRVCVPGGKVYREISFDGKMLAQLINKILKASEEPNNHITLQFFTPKDKDKNLGAVKVLKTESKDLYGVIMPIRNL